MVWANDQDFEKIMQVARRCFDEFGTERVTVLVPKEWQELSHKSSFPFALEFVTDTTVTIRAEADQAVFTYDHQLNGGVKL